MLQLSVLFRGATRIQADAGLKEAAQVPGIKLHCYLSCEPDPEDMIFTPYPSMLVGIPVGAQHHPTPAELYHNFYSAGTCRRHTACNLGVHILRVRLVSTIGCCVNVARCERATA